MSPDYPVIYPNVKLEVNEPVEQFETSVAIDSKETQEIVLSEGLRGKG